MPGDFVLYTRKMINNPLLSRRQVHIELIHPDQGSVAKTDIKAKLSSLFKTPEDAIAVYGVKSKFGGGRSSCFGLIYSNVDARKKFDQKLLTKRDKLSDTEKKLGRKQKKEGKGREKKLRGTAKKGGDKKKKWAWLLACLKSYLCKQALGIGFCHTSETSEQ